MYFSIRCLLLGHDNAVIRAPERLSLRCDHCGRETPGWTLGRSSSHTVSPAPTPFADAQPISSLHRIEHRVAA